MTRRPTKRNRLDDSANALRDIPADRAGLPAKDSIVGVEKLVSAEGDEYAILHTTETDAYEESPQKPDPRRPKDS